MIHQSSAVLYQEHSWQEKMPALSEELLAIEKNGLWEPLAVPLTNWTPILTM